MIHAIVLAAGRSTRMGTQKLLLPYGRKPVIAHIADEAAAAPVADITVVVSPAHEEAIAAALAGRRVRWVVNPVPDGDMLSSVRAGLRSLKGDARGVLILLGDQPSVTAELMTAMVATFTEGPRGIVMPSFEGRRGHPILFAARYREEILNCHDAVGLRGLAAAHPEDVRELSVACSSVLTDIDVPADYQRELRRLQARTTSGEAESPRLYPL